MLTSSTLCSVFTTAATVDGVCAGPPPAPPEPSSPEGECRPRCCLLLSLLFLLTLAAVITATVWLLTQQSDVASEASEEGSEVGRAREEIIIRQSAGSDGGAESRKSGAVRTADHIREPAVTTTAGSGESLTSTAHQTTRTTTRRTTQRRQTTRMLPTEVTGILLTESSLDSFTEASVDRAVGQETMAGGEKEKPATAASREAELEAELETELETRHSLVNLTRPARRQNRPSRPANSLPETAADRAAREKLASIAAEIAKIAAEVTANKKSETKPSTVSSSEAEIKPTISISSYSDHKVDATKMSPTEVNTAEETSSSSSSSSSFYVYHDLPTIQLATYTVGPQDSICEYSSRSVCPGRSHIASIASISSIASVASIVTYNSNGVGFNQQLGKVVAVYYTAF